MKLLIRIIQLPILLIASILMACVFLPCIFIDLARRPLDLPFIKHINE